MSGMNQFLAEYFGTGAPDNDEIQKQAQVEVFLKLAEEEGIDIDQLSDEQVEELYASTFGEEGDGGEEVSEDGLEVQAMAEWAQQKEAADKFAEAEFMGRTMAHAYVDELNKIATKGSEFGRGFRSPNRAAYDAGADSAAERIGRLVGRGTQKAKGAPGKIKALAKGAPGKIKTLAKDAPGKIKNLAGRGTDATKAFAKTRKGKAALIGGGLAAAGAAGGGIYAATREKKATAALDQFAGELAVEKLAYAGFDVNEAISRLNAVITLNDGENTKVAFAGSPEEAVEIRSLELAELAGYPVDWEA